MVEGRLPRKPGLATQCGLRMYCESVGNSHVHCSIETGSQTYHNNIVFRAGRFLSLEGGSFLCTGAFTKAEVRLTPTQGRSQHDVAKKLCSHIAKQLQHCISNYSGNQIGLQYTTASMMRLWQARPKARAGWESRPRLLGTSTTTNWHGMSF